MIHPKSIPMDPIETNRWVVGLRGPRDPISAERPNAVFIEAEATADGGITPTATILLANKECPWRCVMCDLWKHTLPAALLPGQASAQIRNGLTRLGLLNPACQRGVTLKLYNSGSFFDDRAIPPGDDAEIAAMIQGFDRIIVESHPSLVRERTWRFQSLLKQPLEVAMGLETVCPETLPRLGKRVTLDGFRNAAARLMEHKVHLRTFVLIQPPFQDRSKAVEWATRSVDFAFDCGASVVSLVPTRAGNGAMEALRDQGLFVEPGMKIIEETFDQCMQRAQGRVFLDLWDLGRFSKCPKCLAARRRRLLAMNHGQTQVPPVHCIHCG